MLLTLSQASSATRHLLASLTAQKTNLGQAKVSQLEVTALIDKEVVGLHVSA